MDVSQEKTACSDPSDGTRERERERERAQCLRGWVYGPPLPPPADDAPPLSSLSSLFSLLSSRLIQKKLSFIHSFRRSDGRMVVK